MEFASRGRDDASFRRQLRGWRRFRLRAVTVLLALIAGSIVMPISTALAAPGDPAQLYLGASYEAPVVGSNKNRTAPTECPVNSMITAVQTENRSGAGVLANSILTRFSLQCSTITVSSAGVITATVNPTWITGPVYDQSRGNVQTAMCPANTFVHRVTGTTFVGEGAFRWPSSIQITCRPITFTSAGELRVSLAAAPTVLTAGENFNTNGGLDTPTPRCGPGDTHGYE